MRQIPFSPPDITEEEIAAVADALRSGWITTGPKTKEFEREIAKYCHTEYAACLNSATACMEMTLRLFGVGPGDEVITTAYTYTATASAICHTGARPVLVDVMKDSYEMDYDAVMEAVNSKTKAIVPVDIGGVPCDYNRVREIAEEKRSLFQASDNHYQRALGRVLVMADSAHGLGAERNGKRSGALADFTSFSFHAVKNLTTAEGGSVTWRPIPGVDSEDIYREYMLLSLHGQTKDALAKTQLGAWEYDIAAPYYKCNMTDIQAAIGIVQMRRYSSLLERRREIVRAYEEELARLRKTGIPVTSMSHCGENFKSSAHLFLMRIEGIHHEERCRLIEEMARRGLAANVHYKPLPLFTAYRNMGFDIADYPNAYHMYENEISLPLHTKLDEDDVCYVRECVRDVLQERGII